SCHNLADRPPALVVEWKQAPAPAGFDNFACCAPFRQFIRCQHDKRLPLFFPICTPLQDSKHPTFLI
ncbi:MAG: hypothetical protein KDE54_32170, partial [Caldilineaceae bacterium]|nr:hypothetical protein [Caldilineaceae bacterium]